jgi:hypothetical protein
MPKDWNGNKASTFKMIAATNHAPEGYEREERDFYATEPKAAELLLQVEPDLTNVWENACGNMHLANVLEKYGKLGRASDIINRTNDPRIEVKDFLANSSGLLAKKEVWDGDIVSNPPYNRAQEWVERSIETVTEGHKVCMFLKLTFLEGQARREMYKKYPPKVVYVCSGRIVCAMNGEFEIKDKKTGKMKPIGSAVCYAWFVWEKGFKGDPIIKWIN